MNNKILSEELYPIASDFYNNFKSIPEEARLNLIKYTADSINLNRMIKVLSNAASSEPKLFISGNENLFNKTEKPIKNIKNGVITNCWSNSKLTNDVHYTSLQNGWYNFDNGVSGEYLTYYGLLFVFNENHRVCRAILMDKLELNLSKEHRIESYEVNIENFQHVVFYTDGYKIHKTGDEFYKSLTFDELKLWRMIQINEETR